MLNKVFCALPQGAFSLPIVPCKDCESRQTQIDRLKDELHKSSQFRKDIEEESNTKAQTLQVFHRVDAVVVVLVITTNYKH